MAYVPVPKDLNAVKTKVMFNLTKRQILCFGGGALIGVPLFFLLKGHIGSSAAALCMNRQDILDKEVYAIVHKQNPRKKAHTSRAKADRRGDCKSQASG